MKITQLNLERWRENAINLARKMSFDDEILRDLENVQLEIIQKDSGTMFYGYANCFFDDIVIRVFQSNPSKYLSRSLREMWNQSCMDHELIGHVYNYLSKKDFSEYGARNTQMKMIQERAKENPLWNIANFILPNLLKFKDYINKQSQRKIILNCF